MHRKFTDLRRKMVHRMIDSMTDEDIKTVADLLRIYKAGREIFSPKPNPKNVCKFFTYGDVFKRRN